MVRAGLGPPAAASITRHPGPGQCDVTGPRNSPNFFFYSFLRTFFSIKISSRREVMNWMERIALIRNCPITKMCVWIVPGNCPRWRGERNYVAKVWSQLFTRHVQWVTKVMTPISIRNTWKQGSLLLWPILYVFFMGDKLASIRHLFLHINEKFEINYIQASLN